MINYTLSDDIYEYTYIKKDKITLLLVSILLLLLLIAFCIPCWQITNDYRLGLWYVIINGKYYNIDTDCNINYKKEIVLHIKTNCYLLTFIRVLVCLSIISYLALTIIIFLSNGGPRHTSLNTSFLSYDHAKKILITLSTSIGFITIIVYSSLESQLIGVFGASYILWIIAIIIYPVVYVYQLNS